MNRFTDKVFLSGTLIGFVLGMIATVMVTNAMAAQTAPGFVATCRYQAVVVRRSRT